MVSLAQAALTHPVTWRDEAWRGRLRTATAPQSKDVTVILHVQILDVYDQTGPASFGPPGMVIFQATRRQHSWQPDSQVLAKGTPCLSFHSTEGNNPTNHQMRQ
jgi:hypothetical protein